AHLSPKNLRPLCHKLTPPGVLVTVPPPPRKPFPRLGGDVFAREQPMGRTFVVALVAFALGAAGCTQIEQDGEQVRVISSHDIQEELEGNEAKVTIVEVTIAPGQSGLPHRHPGPGFVYVAEGEYELGIDDKPTERFQAGETFYEPTGCLHRVSRNPSTTETTRLIAV